MFAAALSAPQLGLLYSTCTLSPGRAAPHGKGPGSWTGPFCSSGSREPAPLNPINAFKVTVQIYTN